jgi:signal transduction histidine kinase
LTTPAPVNPPERDPGPWLFRPVVLMWLAVVVGWTGVWLAWRDSAAGLLLGGVATVFVATAYSRARAVARTRSTRLEREIFTAQERNRVLGVLRRFAAAQLRLDTLDQLFEEAGRVAEELFNADGAAILVVTEEGRFLRIVAGTGPFRGALGALVPTDRSMAGWVVAHDHGLSVEDAGSDPRSYQVEGVPLAAKKVMMAPLRSSGLVIGVLAVCDRHDGTAFTPEDAHLLDTVAEQVAVGIDRTRALEESRASAEALQLKNQELLRATELKNLFLANMSHELRTPLNAIIGFSDLMLGGGSGPLNPGQEDYLGSISRNGHHLLGLINNILDLSKIEAGATTFALAPTDVRGAVEEAVMDTASLRTARKQTVEVDVGEEPLTVLADRQRVRQILFNLLSNASKFTGEGGHIRVAAVRTQAPLPVPADRASDTPGTQVRDAVWVAVSDDGIGIEPEDMPMLFQEFSQVDASASRRNQGTGLGLALSRKFVDLLGGTIGADSVPGTGSTFWFLLPVDGPIRRPDGAARQAEPGRRVREGAA